MAGEILTEGFQYYGPGTCIECGGALTVIDSDISIMELNQEGFPISEETIVRVKAACSRCGTKYDMMRCNGGYVPYDKYESIYRSYLLKEKAKERIKELRAKSEDKNPFL